MRQNNRREGLKLLLAEVNELLEKAKVNKKLGTGNYYSVAKIESFVRQAKENEDVDSVYVGMMEDWEWTSVEVWNKDVGYTVDWYEGLQGDDSIELAGITGSYWATPQAKAETDDGDVLMEDYVEKGEH